MREGADAGVQAGAGEIFPFAGSPGKDTTSGWVTARRYFCGFLLPVCFLLLPRLLSFRQENTTSDVKSLG